jgi:hypothetical protein
MKTVTIPITTLETLIESLQDAVNICYNVDSTDGNCERTYPYATGYSRAAMETTISNLKELKDRGN